MLSSCPTCGAPNTQSHKFCSVCGTLLLATDSPPDNALRVQSWDEAAVGPDVQEDPKSGPYIPTPPSSLPAPYGSATSAPQQSGRERPLLEGERRGDATYAPHSAGAAKHIERERPVRSWLLPTVVVAALVLLGLVVAVVYLLLSPGTPTEGGTQQGTPRGGPSSAPAPSTCELPDNPTPEDEVSYTVCLSNEEQIRAWRELNSEVLAGTRTGAFLEENVAAVEEMRRKRIYGIPVNEKLDILDVRIDGDRATVETYEEWSVTFYSLGDDRVVNSRGPDKYFETYHMVKLNGKWLVERVDFVEPTPGTSTRITDDGDVARTRPL